MCSVDKPEVDFRIDSPTTAIRWEKRPAKGRTGSLYLPLKTSKTRKPFFSGGLCWPCVTPTSPFGVSVWNWVVTANNPEWLLLTTWFLLSLCVWTLEINFQQSTMPFHLFPWKIAWQYRKEFTWDWRRLLKVSQLLEEPKENNWDVYCDQDCLSIDVYRMQPTNKSSFVKLKSAT